MQVYWAPLLLLILFVALCQATTLDTDMLQEAEDMPVDKLVQPKRHWGWRPRCYCRRSYGLGHFRRWKCCCRLRHRRRCVWFY